jgi:ABC-type thiamin/hydroxymethylpyrimidine transport system permease subunit
MPKAMKKRFKNFCAGFFLTMLIPGFIGGQLLSGAAQRHLQAKALQKACLTQQQAAPDQQAHLMDEALCILP